jgi:TolB-like protein
MRFRARNSSFAYKSKSIDAKQIAQELGGGASDRRKRASIEETLKVSLLLIVNQTRSS